MERPKAQILLARNLRACRNFLGLSQMKLGEMCNLSTNFISELEGGKVWVSAETLDTLAKNLNVELHSLFLPGNPKDEGSGRTGVVDALESFTKRNSDAVDQLRRELLGLVNQPNRNTSAKP